VHPKGADSMSSLGLALETPWLAVSGCPSMHEQAEKTVLSPCVAPISGREAFSQSV